MQPDGVLVNLAQQGQLNAKQAKLLFSLPDYRRLGALFDNLETKQEDISRHFFLRASKTERVSQRHMHQLKTECKTFDLDCSEPTQKVADFSSGDSPVLAFFSSHLNDLEFLFHTSAITCFLLSKFHAFGILSKDDTEKIMLTAITKERTRQFWVLLGCADNGDFGLII